MKTKPKSKKSVKRPVQKPLKKGEKRQYSNQRLGKKDYIDYITGDEWRQKSRDFYKESGKRCSFLGITIKRYNSHHMNYKNLGCEVLWEDVCVMHPFIHKWVLHGVLSCFLRPSQQKSYPNFAQKTFHFWCCQPHILRKLFLMLVMWYTLGFYGVIGFVLFNLAIKILF